MAKKKSRADVVHVDFSKAEGGRGRTRVPEGDYLLEVVSVKKTTAESSGNPMLVWKFKIAEGKHEGKPMYDNTVLIPKSLGFLQDLLEAMGVNVGGKAVNLPIRKFKGKQVGATIVDGEEFNNRVSSEIASYMSVDVLNQEDEDEDEDEEDEDEFDEDEEEDDEDEDEEEDEDEDDELDEVDLEDL